MQTISKSTHSRPIYFVELTATTLTTSTQSARDIIGFDGFPVTYEQRVNLATGEWTCTCAGCKSIARRVGRVTAENGCKHIKKAQQSGEEWGYLDAQEEVAEQEFSPSPNGEPAAPVFDYCAYFDAMYE